jgi:hypothetical protein
MIIEGVGGVYIGGPDFFIYGLGVNAIFSPFLTQFPPFLTKFLAFLIIFAL